MNPLRAATVALATVAACTVFPGSGSTISAENGHEGACDDNVGVTVVVDFQELGGGVNVRCAPNGASSGIDALEQAGVAWTDTLRQPGFVCRIAGFPGLDREKCVNTPPASAYWSYWVAPRGGDWCYVNFGAGNRTPPPGTIEGWSFASNKTASAIPPPRFVPPAPIAGQPPNPLNRADCTSPSQPGTPVPAPAPAPQPPVAATTTAPNGAGATPPAAGNPPANGPTAPAPDAPAPDAPPQNAPGGAAPAPGPAGRPGPTATTLPSRVTTTSTSVGGADVTESSVGRGSDESLDDSATPTDEQEAPTTVTATTGDAVLAGDGRTSGALADEQDASDRTIPGDDAAADDVAGPRPGQPTGPAGSVDLGDDGRSDSGFGVSTILAIVAVAAFAGGALVVARRRRATAQRATE